MMLWQNNQQPSGVYTARREVFYSSTVHSIPQSFLFIEIARRARFFYPFIVTFNIPRDKLVPVIVLQQL